MSIKQQWPTCGSALSAAKSKRSKNPKGQPPADCSGAVTTQIVHVIAIARTWFEKLTSGKGPCCSDADGSVVLDSDWESKDGHYRVRIKDKWWDVPAEAVITEPNKVGRTMVWPIYYWNGNSLDRVDIRCFMPGAMT